MAQSRYGIVLSFLVCFLVSCTGTSSFESSGSTTTGSNTTGETETNLFATGDVTSLTFSGSTLTVSLDDVTADDNVVLVLFAENSSSTTVGVQVAESESAFSSESLASETSFSFADGFQASSNDVVDMTEEVHGILRDMEQDVEPDQQVELQASLTGVDTSVTLGSEDDFYVLNSLSGGGSFETVTATLVYQTEFFNYYIDNDELDSLSDDDLEELSENFADVIPLIRDIFGDESDVNSDGKFDVLSTPLVNGLAGSPNSIVTGYWYANDLGSSSNSNQREIIYTMVPDPSGTYGSVVTENFAVSNIIRGVLVHEYQHMINYNMHVNENGGSTEDSWLNESLSHLIEDIYDTDSDDYMLSSGNENPARVDVYLDSIDSTCFTCGTNLAQRGGGYLFLRYLYEQAYNGEFSNLADGAEFIAALLDTDETGTDNIVNAVYGSSGSSDNFYDLMGQFTLAVYLSNTGITSNTLYNFDGINLRATQDDNRSTVLAGPESFELDDLSYTDAVTGNSVLYLEIDGETIVNNSGELSLSVGSGQDMRGFVLIY